MCEEERGPVFTPYDVSFGMDGLCSLMVIYSSLKTYVISHSGPQ